MSGCEACVLHTLCHLACVCGGVFLTSCVSCLLHVSVRVRPAAPLRKQALMLQV